MSLKSLFLVHMSKLTLGLYDMIVVVFLSTPKLQQLRGTSFSAWHWSKHGKGGKDGQRHDKGTVGVLLKEKKTLTRMYL